MIQMPGHNRAKQCDSNAHKIIIIGWFVVGVMNIGSFTLEGAHLIDFTQWWTLMQTAIFIYFWHPAAKLDVLHLLKEMLSFIQRL